MKKTCNLALLLCLVSAGAYAQPVLNATAIPANGFVTDIYFTAKPNPGPSGANIVWNFSSLPYTEDGNVAMVKDPASTPFYTRYNTANFCIASVAYGDTLYSYYNRNSTKFDKLGEGVSNTLPGAELDFLTDNRLWFNFPFHYNDTTSDTWKGAASRGRELIKYDGYGTLITPFDTFRNVVRIREIRYDTLTGSAPVLDTTYTWLSTNPIFQVLEIARNFTIIAKKVPPQTTGIGRPDSKPNPIRIYPNPARQKRITIEAGNLSGTLMICDINGKQLQQVTLTGKQPVVLTGLNTGLYFYRLYSSGTLDYKGSFVVE